jgi:hypothetical protein
LKISHYNVLFDQGEKIAKKKIEKFDSLLNKKYKGRELLEVLLITNENTYFGSSQVKQDETKRLYVILENVGMNFSNGVNSNLKKILETIIYVNSELKKLENQQRIMTFIQSYYKNMLEKINKQFIILSDSHSKFKEKKEELREDFVKNLSEVREIMAAFLNSNSGDELNVDLKFIEKSYDDFKKIFSIFEDKLKNFNLVFSNFKEKTLNKLKDNNLNSLPKNFKDVEINFYELYSQITKIISGKFNIREILANIESSWNNSKLHTMDLFNNVYKIRVIY